MRSNRFALHRLLLVACVSATVATPAAAEPVWRGQVQHVQRAVFAQGRLWVLTRAGAVLSVAPGEGALRLEQRRGAVDLCVQDGHPIQVAVLAPGAYWTVSRREPAGWRDLTTQDLLPGESVRALACGEGGPIVLSSTRVVSPNSTWPTSIGARHSRVAATLLSGTTLFVGLDEGEWGGGLHAIDLRSGLARAIERKTSGRNCFRPLDAACDPVNGLVPSLDYPGCIVAAIGLRHMGSIGRLVELCGNEVRTLATCPLEAQDGKWVHKPCVAGDSDTFESVPFEALARGRNHLYAFSPEGVPYRVEVGLVERLAAPTFEDVEGLRVSWSVPDVVLVRSAIGGENRVGTVGVVVAER